MEENSTFGILIVEGKRGDHTSFAAELDHRDYQISRVSSGKAGLEMLDDVDPSAVVVDAASLRTNGVRICQSFRKADGNLPIILIVDKAITLPDVVDATLVLRLPFTVQKLINRLHAFRETDHKFLIKVGPIELNTKTQLVTCHDRQTKLTPRLVALLKMLMKNKGKVMGRNELFTKIWNTDYTGDTRTLDVHISWLRHAIEEDHTNPKLLQTRRGKGYFLDL